MFLIGYLLVGFFGQPDLIVSGILFGGSIFVCVMYYLLNGITRRLMESHEVEAKLRAAEEVSRTKKNFLAAISHDMRTPMNVILGLDRIALRRPGLPDETRDKLKKIEQSGQYLQSIINNMLDLQQIETGELSLRHEAFALHDVLNQLDAVSNTMCENKGLAFRMTVAYGAEDWYRGDELTLKQILFNLLDNAAKYTEAPGRVTFTVENVSEEANTRTLRFIVKDTGIGISPEFLQKVFDVFSQEDSTSTNKYGGSGLGLAIVREKVELMGGHIEAESEQNVGSTFIVTLPLEITEPVDSGDTSESGTVELEGRRILIVEDIPENAEITADLLEMEGTITERAENGQVAVAMFEQNPPYYYDAILMDLRMPTMDGMEATRTIRNMDRSDAKIIPIIALTANAFERDVKSTMDAGMNAHLAKPIDSDMLYSYLKHWIWKSQEGSNRV